MIADTKQQITQSARQIMAKESIDKITVGDLAKKLGISRQTFYYYFKDKYDLLAYIFSSDIDRVLEDTQDKEMAWSSVLTEMLVFMHGHKEFYVQSMKTEGQNSFWNIILDYTQNAYIEEVKRRTGLETIGEELLFSIHFNSYGAAGSIFSWIREGMEKSPQELAWEIARNMPQPMKKHFNVSCT